MSNIKKGFTIGALGLAACGLIGAGAAGTFTDAVHTNQDLTAGQLNVTIAPASGTAGTVSSDAHTVTLDAVKDLGSTFHTDPASLVITNSGSVTANAIQFSMDDRNKGNDADFTKNVNVKVMSCNPTCGDPAATPVKVYNGSVEGLTSNPIPIAGSLGVGKTDGFTVEFYTPDNSSLPSAAEGETFKPSFTVTYNG